MDSIVGGLELLIKLIHLSLLEKAKILKFTKKATMIILKMLMIYIRMI
jgi:hypothetical protein